MAKMSDHKLFWIASIASGLVVALLTLFFVVIVEASSRNDFLSSGALGWIFVLFGILLGMSLFAFLRNNKVLSAALLTGIVWALIFMGCFASVVILQIIFT